MSQFTWDVASLASLRKQWERSMRFGALMAPLHPTPSTGDKVEVRIRCTWEGRSIEVSGLVVQASEANSVVQLEPLPNAARKTLTELGVEGVPAAVEQPPADAAPPAPEPAPAEPAPPPAPTLTAAPPTAAEPPSPPPAAAKPPGPPRPAGSFRPKPAAFSPRPVKPGSFSPRPATPPPPGQRPAAFSPPPGPTPTPVTSAPPPSRPAAAPAAVDADITRIAASGGPASLSAEALLRPATQHGDFSKVSWRDALLHFYEQRATGVLAVEAFREIRWCFLVNGDPVHYLGDKPHPGEFLSDALLADGVDAATWSKALRIQQVTGVQAGQHLVATGVISQSTLDAALSRRAERITRNLMGMNFGTFRFHELPEVGQIFTWKPVEALGVLLSHQRESLKAVDDDVLVQKVEGFYPLHVKPIAARVALMQKLPLEEEERRLVQNLLPAAWTLGELVGLKEMEERRLVRLLFALKALGMVEFVRDEGEGSRRNRAERILYSGLKDLTRRNDFEALHSHWSSSESEIRRGYQRVLDEFGGERFTRINDPRIQDLIARIGVRAEEVWARLSTRPNRKEVRKKVVGVDQLRMASDLLDKQGVMASFKSDFRVVRACYERVVELEPGGPEGVENMKRAKQWLSDPRVTGVAAADLSGMTEELDSLV
jgi:hypothetical protein